MQSGPLVWKATKEIHHRADPDPGPDIFDRKDAKLGFAAAMGQIVLLDMVFSIDSIITAVGMTEHIPIMVIAVVVAFVTMLIAATACFRISKLLQHFPAQFAA
jgi:predicted tellurium resistance membrane protein TerC